METIHIAYIWWTIGCLLLLGEIALPGLTVFFFGVGGLVVGLLCFLFPGIAGSLNLQLLFFLGFSVGSLLLLRRSLVRVFQGAIGAGKDRMPEELKGRRVEVVEKITPDRPGKVLLNGVAWMAESDAEFHPGDVVEITGRESLTLRVQRRRNHPEIHERKES